MLLTHETTIVLNKNDANIVGQKRGIYIVDTVIYNADAVGAYNILRKYHAVSGK